MSDFTQILSQISEGDSHASAELMKLVYSELRRLAQHKMAHERPGQTLSATALVHEAYLRLFGGECKVQHWDSRGHFFAAAADAMRRILIDNARRKCRLKRGGAGKKVDLTDHDLAVEDQCIDLLALDEAVKKLEAEDVSAAQVVKLKVFGGLSIEQIADVLGCSRATAYRQWKYARAWLSCSLEGARK